MTDTISKNHVGLFTRIFTNSQSKVLDYFLAHTVFDYSEADISRAAKVSPRQVARALGILHDVGLIEFTRKLGRSNMYRLNTNSQIVIGFQKVAVDFATERNEKLVRNADSIHEISSSKIIDKQEIGVDLR